MTALGLEIRGQFAHQLGTTGGHVNPVFSLTESRQQPMFAAQHFGNFLRAKYHGHHNIDFLDNVCRAVRPFRTLLQERGASFGADVMDHHGKSLAPDVESSIPAHGSQTDESDNHCPVPPKSCCASIVGGMGLWQTSSADGQHNEL